MAALVKIRGVDRAVQTIRARGRTLQSGVRTGIARACLFLQRESMLIVPVDTGNLRNTAFTRLEGDGFRTKGRVGYTAYYAIYVHENTTARHNPGQQAKFLEAPARRHRRKLIQIVQEACR